jgi:two-component system response regulator BaeR
MKTTRRVLVVEDDPRIALLLADYLRSEGFEALTLADGQLALSEVRHSSPHLVILDLNLPGLDGVSLCRSIREFSNVPILMVTARIDELDRLVGLNSGADDYVCKPFSPREVMARVHALLRRTEQPRADALAMWTVDGARLRIQWYGQWLQLTPLEFRILRQLLSHPWRVFSRGQFLDNVHAEFRDAGDRAIDTHVKNLRRKLQMIDPDDEYITSVYAMG